MTTLSTAVLVGLAGRRGHGGFTLVELMVGIALLAVLLSVAIPSYQGAIANQNVGAAASALQSAIALTRSEAIKRNSSVSLRPVTVGNWTGGWWIAPVSSNSLEAALHRERPTGGVTVLASDAGALVFNRSGRLSGSLERTFQIEASADPDKKRCVTVSLDGRSGGKAGGCS